MLSTHRRVSTSLMRDVELLHKFFDALFSSRILEARKYFPSVTMSLRQRVTTPIFIPELVNKLMRNGAYLSPDQFEVMVRLVNCALVDEKIAMQILPLTSVFYQVSGDKEREGEKKRGRERGREGGRERGREREGVKKERQECNTV